jgi:aspartate/methionine/tyrosine aminotransferase
MYDGETLMKLEQFDLERIQSVWEHEVEINLTESGVSPVTLDELVRISNAEKSLLALPLGYSQTNGSAPLRARIAEMYPGTTPDNVLMTNGGAEANFLTAWNLFHEGDRDAELVVLVPNYMQFRGAWRNFGGRVRTFHLKMCGGRWIPDIEELKSTVSSRTAAIAICNPNNPTGAIIGEEEVDAIADISEDAGAWLVSDEIYRGAEFGQQKSPTAISRTEKVIVTSSLSKVYGLPGIRVGWIVSPDVAKIGELWAYSDYTTICLSRLSDHLASIALEPKIRRTLETRAKSRVKQNWNIMKEWLDAHDGVFSYCPPEAASMCFPKYSFDISSVDLAERLRTEKSVLVAPGAYFGMDGFLRLGFGYEESKLHEGLKRIDELIGSLQNI